MNIANQLTLFRIILTVPFMFFLSMGAKDNLNNFKEIASIIFVVAAITDFFDGYLARKKNMVTDFGKIMDPLADKILVVSALLIFVELAYIPAWMVILILTRDSLVAGIRNVAASKGEVIAAGPLGKYKTATQMISIVLIIFLGNHPLTFLLMLIPVVLTIWSGVDYCMKGKDYLLNSK